jgi:hypothetical protein
MFKSVGNGSGSSICLGRLGSLESVAPAKEVRASVLTSHSKQQHLITSHRASRWWLCPNPLSVHPISFKNIMFDASFLTDKIVASAAQCTSVNASKLAVAAGQDAQLRRPFSSLYVTSFITRLKHVDGALKLVTLLAMCSFLSPSRKFMRKKLNMFRVPACVKGPQ